MSSSTFYNATNLVGVGSVAVGGFIPIAGGPTLGVIGNVYASTGFWGAGNNISNVQISTSFSGLNPGGVIYAQTVNQILSSAAGSSGQFLVSGGSGAPTFKYIAASDLPVSGVSAGTSGSGTLIPVITYDTYGRLTSVSTSAVSVNPITGGTTYAPIVATGATTLASLSSAGSVGQPLLSGGAGANPSYGTLGVAYGGSGATSFTAYGVITGGTTSTSAQQSVTPGNAGQVLVSGGLSALPTWASSLSSLSSLSATNLYGTLAGSNAISGSSVSAGSGTISTSGTISGGTITGTTLYGTLAGSNAISGSSVSAGSGTISTSGTISGGTITASASLYGTLSGSNVANVSTLNVSSVSSPVMNMTATAVGIGTTNPTAPLVVSGGTSSSNTIIIIDNSTNAGTGQGVQLAFQNNSGGVKPMGNMSVVRHNNAGNYSSDFVFSPSNDIAATERVRILGDSGNVGIGVANPTSLLQLAPGGTANLVAFYTQYNTDANFAAVSAYNLANGTVTGPSGGDYTFTVGSTSPGSLQIHATGTTIIGGATYKVVLVLKTGAAPGTINLITGPSNTVLYTLPTLSATTQSISATVTVPAGDTYMYLSVNGTSKNIIYSSTGSISATRLDNVHNGRVGIGTTNPTATLDVRGQVRAQVAAPSYILSDGTYTAQFGLATGINNYGIGAQPGDAIIRTGQPYNSNIFITGSSSFATQFVVQGSTGNVGIGTTNPGSTLTVNGSLSKSSGTFDIPHPILPEPNRLVHSFLEGPRCDLIYRGSVKLENGSASVNIDSDCTSNASHAMTQGTFVSLCTSPVYYLQNDGSFDRVRGTINGNILTIICENNTSSDLINWMVVAERKDDFIKQWNRTDSDGHLIPEY